MSLSSALDKIAIEDVSWGYAVLGLMVLYEDGCGNSTNCCRKGGHGRHTLNLCPVVLQATNIDKCFAFWLLKGRSLGYYSSATFPILSRDPSLKKKKKNTHTHIQKPRF